MGRGHESRPEAPATGDRADVGERSIAGEDDAEARETEDAVRGADSEARQSGTGARETGTDEIRLERLGPGRFDTDHGQLRLRVGDRIHEGDAARIRAASSGIPALQSWTLVELGPGSVILRDDAGGEETWDRAWFEARLAAGQFSTDPGVAGRADLESPGSAADGPGPTDFPAVHVLGPVTRPVTAASYGCRDPEPTIVVVACGDDGRECRRRYRLLDPAAGVLALVADDVALRSLDATARARLDEATARALAAAGYTLVGS